MVQEIMRKGYARQTRWTRPDVQLSNLTQVGKAAFVTCYRLPGKSSRELQEVVSGNQD